MHLEVVAALNVRVSSQGLLDGVSVDIEGFDVSGVHEVLVCLGFNVLRIGIGVTTDHNIHDDVLFSETSVQALIDS